MRIDKLEKNYLINSSYRNAQWSTASVSIPGSIAFSTVDRWRVGFNAPASSCTSQRVATIPSGSKARYSLKLSGASTGGGGSLVTSQKIESVFAKDLAGEVVSFSAMIRSENAQNAKLVIRRANAEDNHAGGQTVEYALTARALTVSTSFTLVKWENISLSSLAGNGLEVEISLDTFATNGIVKDHFIHQPMLNIGPIALPWSLATLNEVSERLLCQNYLQKSYDFDTPIGTATYAGAFQFLLVGTASVRDSFGATGIPMRSSPSVTVYPTHVANSPGNITERSPDTSRAITAGIDVSQNHGGYLSTDSLTANRHYAFQWVKNAEIN